MLKMKFSICIDKLQFVIYNTLNGEKMKIVGKVEQIIYKNELNSWTVLLIKVDKKYITAVGPTADIELEDTIEFEGEYVTHKVYGEQIKFETYIKVLPKDENTLINYIADNIKGVGRKIAERIVNEFKDETIDVIRYNPSKLEQIKGLNSEKIIFMSDFFNDEWEKWNVVKFLGDFNISVVLANKIYLALGKDTIKTVNENPYSLLDFVKTIDFKLIDNIALELGIEKNSYSRIDSGILYLIGKITEFGHTCVEEENFVKYCVKNLEVGEDEIRNGIVRLKLSEKIFIENRDEVNYVFRKGYYLAEKNIATYISDMVKQKISSKDFAKEIEKVSEKNSLVLSSEQKEAIQMCLNSNISIITGGPGTGKTTIIKCIMDLLDDDDKKYILAAPTGRAVKRITETTKKPAKTLHRLLEITKVDDNNLEKMINVDVKIIETDFLIIDEASMIDTIMMNNLVRALKKKTKLIFVGDIDQLPSVGPGTVLKDIIDTKLVPTMYLNTIYRQSSKSDIVVKSHMVNAGEHFDFKNKDTDLYFIKCDTVDEVISEMSSLISHRLEGYANLDIMHDLQILTPTKKTELGVTALNKKIQEILNRKSTQKKEKTIGERTFRVGDKVMQIVNNYDKKFSINGEFFEGVYNGDIGYIKDIDFEAEKFIVNFDDEKDVEYDFDEADELEHAYAITIHKSQGSEFDYVILPLLVGYKKLFTRNLLYTAMTRAKKMLIILGNKQVIDYMIDNVEEKNRLTGLKYKILSNI